MRDAAPLLLVLVPLLCACAVLALPRALAAAAVLAGLVATPLLLLPVTARVLDEGVFRVALGGFAPPLGIALHVDGLAVLLLWLVAVVTLLAGVHALCSHGPSRRDGQRLWPLWLLLTGAMNALVLAADLFNIYVALELVTLTAIPLVALGGGEALRAALRYLLLAMLGSMVYLLGVALLYHAHGTLDLALLAEVLGGDARSRLALVLVSGGLLLKAAIFPLHAWLPGAHASAPGAVSALLSALVVKLALVVLWRVWLFAGAALPRGELDLVLGLMGAGALLYGSVAALVQQRLKLLVAYSTVAQLGYLMLLFPLAGALAWHGAIYQLLSHALAKAAMFLAAANLLQALGSDRIDRLARAARHQPLALFSFALAGTSIMGLPPSGGFLAKWMLLEAAWRQQAWGWTAVIVIGSLLAAAYVFRVLAAAMRRPAGAQDAPPLRPVAAPMQYAALVLALLAIAAGFGAAPLLALVEIGSPFVPAEWLRE